MSLTLYSEAGAELPLLPFFQALVEAEAERTQAYLDARVAELMDPQPHYTPPLRQVIVVNHYKLAEQCPLGYKQVRIGRPSVLGNPFKLGEPYADGRPGVYQRGEAVVDHEAWFRQQMRDPSSPVREEIMRLAHLVADGHGLALVCYCHPKPCHGDILAKAILAYAQQLRNGTNADESAPR